VSTGGTGGTTAAPLWVGDWETGNLSQWNQAQTKPGGITVVTSPLDQGRYAAKFIVHPGDDPINSSGERAEVRRTTGESEGQERWWSWSTRFDSSYDYEVGSGTWNIFTQWHDGADRGCSPPMFFDVSAGRLRMGARGGVADYSGGHCTAPTSTKWDLGPLAKDHWYHFLFHVRWSSSANTGFVELWLDNQPIVPRTSVATLYAGDNVYFKQGLYRSESVKTATLYHDGTRFGLTRGSVGY